ncbi:MAG TPA: hypothetical protein VF444_00520 [Pseudonocardiaceae bacterium]
MTVMVNMNSTSDTSGAGVADSWHGVATTIDELKSAHGAQVAALSVELGISVVGAVADTIAFAIDPFAKLISAGLGWLIEHISFLKAPLDQLLGNPQGVQALAEALHKTAEHLRNAASDMGDSLKKTITQWTGVTADTFQKSATDLQGQIDNTGHAVDVAGYLMDTTGAVIAAVRNLVRDMITTVLGDIIATVLLGLALAPITFGASLVAAVGKAVVDAVRTVTRAMKVLKAVVTFGKSASQTSHELAIVLHDMPRIPRGGSGRPYTGTHTSARPAIGDSGGDSVHGSTSSSEGGHNTPPPTTTNGDHTPEGNTTPPPTTSGDHTTAAPTTAEPSTSTGEESGSGFYDDGGDNAGYDTWLQWDKTHGDDAPSSGNTTGHTDGDTAEAQTPPANGHEDPPTEQPSSTTDHTNEDTGGDPGSGPAKDSFLKSSEMSQMKKHEDWLKNEQKDPDGNKLPPSQEPFRQQLADFWKGTNKTGVNPLGLSDADKAEGKFGLGVKGWENYLKDEHRPDWVKDAYPWLKTASDAKSSKTGWGMIDKTILNLDKSLTPIQEHADQGWEEADQEDQGDNPDGGEA